MGVEGTDHVTVEGTNLEDTLEFSRDLLGMPLVLAQPDLDRREFTHLFFDTGDGRMLTFFAGEERDSADLPSPDPDRVHHLAFRIDGDRIEEITESLEAAGYPVSEYDRGAFHSLYTEDNDGLADELVADKFAVPTPGEGRCSRWDTGSASRTARSSSRPGTFARPAIGSAMREAIGRLGLAVEEKDVRDAPTDRDLC